MRNRGRSAGDAQIFARDMTMKPMKWDRVADYLFDAGITAKNEAKTNPDMFGKLDKPSRDAANRKLLEGELCITLCHALRKGLSE